MNPAEPEDEGREEMTDKPTLTLGRFCHACQAIPQAGYCHLAGCPTAPGDLKPTLTDEEAEKLKAAYYDLFRVAPGTETWAMAGLPSFEAVQAIFASPGPALRGEGGSSSASLPATSRVATGRWRSMESAPKDGTRIDLWVVGGEHGSYRAPNAVWDTDAQDWRTGTFTLRQYVHVPAPVAWMSPPEPPPSDRPLEGRDVVSQPHGMPKDFLPPDVKAAVERLSVLEAHLASENFDEDAEAVATLLASHTALTEANERLTTALKEISADHNPNSEQHTSDWWINLVWSYKKLAREALLAQTIGEGS